ncbi:hypothetical protein CYMTET_15746 [Cymbomonas tetramitiformis]|uniref:Uncharacterized protein n=1 Tax=Cymbomonas tetramitiformis TaxID=36881 RepID=A0AAE0GDH0_9CHLO|nr:hypothetical protein CYMTET_15746 [Cymbomonas tetramitiformis]
MRQSRPNHLRKTLITSFFLLVVAASLSFFSAPSLRPTRHDSRAVFPQPHAATADHNTQDMATLERTFEPPPLPLPMPPPYGDSEEPAATAVSPLNEEVVELLLSHDGLPMGSGVVRIKLDRVSGPAESADYVKTLAQLPGGLTGEHEFFRAEKDTLLQGDKGQAEAWKHDHTVWGRLADQESFDTLDAVYKLPTHRDGVTVLTESVQFRIRLL